MGSSSECYVLKWDEFHSSVANSFTDLRNEEDFLDVTVAIDQEHQLQAHKVVLSASSPYFREILKRNPAQHPVLVMPPTIRYTDLAAVIDFIYQGEVKIPITEVDEFVALAQMLKIRGLTEDLEKAEGGKKAKAQPRLPPGTQMVRKRSVPPQSQPVAPNPQAKRSRSIMPAPMINPPKFVGAAMQQGPPPPPPDGDEMAEDDDLHEVDDEESSDMYGDFDDQFEGSEFPMENPGQPGSSTSASAAAIQLTGLLCPKCRTMCKGLDAFKDHMTKMHGLAPDSNTQQSPGEENIKKHTCHICDKAFKTAKYVQAHIKRVHKVESASSSAAAAAAAAVAASAQPDHHQSGEDADELMMEAQMAEAPPSLPPGKKKGRPKKNDQHHHQQPQQQHPQPPTQPQQHQGGMSRPIGQVPPAPRPTQDSKEMHEQSRPPVVQQDRGASPMAARQRPPGMMSPSSSGHIVPSKRSMAPQGIMGPGMRPRGPMPQQFHQGYLPQGQQQSGHPMDIKKLGMKLGGAISITSSESGYSSPQQQPSSMRRAIPSTSRMHASSPKSDPLAPSVSRPPSLPQRHLSQEQPVEVKQEPMDDMYEEGEDLADDYEEEGEGFGEEEEEEEEDEQEFGQDAMYAGEAPYDDEVEHDNGAYHQ